MILPDELKRIAAWSRDLREEEFEEARRGISFRSYGKGAGIITTIGCGAASFGRKSGFGDGHV